MAKPEPWKFLAYIIMLPISMILVFTFSPNIETWNFSYYVIGIYLLGCATTVMI
jgi:hypothetical protein